MLKREHKVSNISSEAIFAIPAMKPYRVVIAISLCFAFMLSDITYNSSVILRSFALDLLKPVNLIIELPVQISEEVFDNLSSKQDLQRKVDALEEENLKLKVSNEYLQKLSIDLSKLNTLWSSIDIQKDRFVISEKNFLSSNTFQPMLVLTIQDPKEIEKNSPVISEQGLVGRINNIGVLTAEVLLLQDIRSSVPIISGESSLHGILNGKGLDRKGELQFIKKTANFKKGENILISDKKGNKIQEDLYKGGELVSSKKINEVFVRASPVMEFLTGIMIAFLIFISAKLITNNELEVSNFFSFLAAMMLAYQPVRSLATINITIQQGLAGAKRVLPVIDEKPEVRDKDNIEDLEFKKGDIDFENVNFNYSNEGVVLKSINLNFPGEKMTALVGLSGAGKSTILNLIPRFYNIQNGDIKIDQQSIYNHTLYSLRKGISLVSQDTTLFDDTVKNNISYANLNATEEEIKEAARHSFADEFIQKLPNQYDTLIGENGVRLSGGEKQRLSIARAILKKSPIILLDEATSSLDSETESKIQKAINFLRKGRTTIVIAHRLSTILNSDKIYVIDRGQVIESGTHDTLLNSSQIYKNFYEKQIKK